MNQFIIPLYKVQEELNITALGISVFPKQTCSHRKQCMINIKKLAVEYLLQYQLNGVDKFYAKTISLISFRYEYKN